MNYKRTVLMLAIFFVLFYLITPSQLLAQEKEYELEVPSLILTGVSFTITIKSPLKAPEEPIPFTISTDKEGVLFKGELKDTQEIEAKGLKLSHAGITNFYLNIEGQKIKYQSRAIPGFLSILPPLIAIALALILRQVIVSLLAGVWLGALFIFNYNPLIAFLRTLDRYYALTITDRSHALILLFSLAVGGLVGVAYRSGGMHGLVEKISKIAKNARSGQIVARIMGVLIFFDDYSNTLIVGNTMRPFTDKLKISREKLSYILDSSAACIASVAIISTWIGFEVSLINDGFASIGVDRNAYITFLQTIPSRFYPIFTLIFGFAAAIMVRDFGSMYKAEIRARTKGQLIAPGATPISDPDTALPHPPKSAPHRWANAVIPILSVIAVTFIGLYASGRSSLIADKGMAYFQKARLYEVIGAGDSFAVLFWAFIIGAIIAIVMALTQRILTLEQSLDAWVAGIKSMVMACIILISAWAIGSLCSDLKTADYVIEISQKFLSPHLLPAASFFLACFIAFATGTSWGTMAILMPIVVPLGYKAPIAAGFSAGMSESILLGSIAGVLAGAAFGDHCSPISDTTIMSSMAAGSDHIDHVKTQIPYAFLAGAVSIAIGYLPMGYGISPAITIPIGGVFLILFLRFYGKKTDNL